MDLRQRYGPWALVVGGSAGIGAAAADEAAGRGLNVVTVARRRALLDERAATMRAVHGVEVRTIATDLTHPDAVQAIVGGTADLEVGTLIYNAAAEPRGSFLDVPLAAHLDSIAVNCTVPTALVHHYGKPMVGRGQGAIVLVTSMGAFQGAKVFTSYFAAKAYEWILAEGLWAELREVGVDAFSYVVGATRTETYQGQADGSSDPAGTVAEPEDGDEAVADPSSRSARWRLQHPSDPDAVGRRIFDVLDAGPTAFSEASDQANSAVALQPDRQAAVESMSLLTSGIRH
jgi:short-subunit dehydrogenase